MRKLTGTVVSAKMAKTAVVEIVTRRPHPLYKKVLRRTKRYKADTGALLVSVGDTVVVVATRPVSKQKRFRITEVVAK